MVRAAPQPRLLHTPRQPPLKCTSRYTHHAIVVNSDPDEGKSRDHALSQVLRRFRITGPVPLVPGTNVALFCMPQVSDKYRSSAEAASEQLRLMKEAQLLQDQLKQSTQRYGRPP